MQRADTKKAQVVLSADQYELLHEYATEQGKPMSALLRENIEQTLVAMLDRRRRERALQRLINQNLPTDDWETIERQLEERWYGHEPD